MVADQFSISPAAAGNLVTVSQVGYGLGLIFVMPIGDLVERRRLITLMCLGTGVLSLTVGLAPSSNILFAMIFLLGIMTVFAQSLLPLAAELSSEENQNKNVGTVLMGLLLGILLARTVAGGVAELAGWRAVYILSAVLMVGCAIGLRATLPIAPAHAKMGYVSLLKSLVDQIRTYPVLRYRMLLGGLAMASFSTLWTPLTFFLAGDYHMSEGIIGLFGLAGATGALAARIVGGYIDRGYGKAVTFIGAIAQAISWAIMLLGMMGGYIGIVLLIAGIMVLDFGIQAMHVTNQSQVFSLDPAARSRLNGAYMGAYFIGGALGTAISSAAWGLWQWPGVCAVGAAQGITLVVLGLPSVQQWVRNRDVTPVGVART